MAWPGSLAATAAGTKEKRHEGRAFVAPTHVGSMLRDIGRRARRPSAGTPLISVPAPSSAVGAPLQEPAAPWSVRAPKRARLAKAARVLQWLKDNEATIGVGAHVALRRSALYRHELQRLVSAATDSAPSKSSSCRPSSMVPVERLGGHRCTA